MGYVEETNELKLDFKKITRMIGQEVIPVAIQNVNTKEIILVAYTILLAVMIILQLLIQNIDTVYRQKLQLGQPYMILYQLSEFIMQKRRNDRHILLS